jgi:polyhydroxyalkanoate synthase
MPGSEQAAAFGLQSAWTELGSLGVLPSWLCRVKVGATPHDEIFSKGNLRLLRYRGEVTQATPIVILPSLINRHYILDLLPERSLVETFVRAGFETYMLAWTNPPAEDRYLTPEDLFKRRILKAVDVASGGNRKVHLVGQCLGGTLATMAALLAPEKFASLSLLTAPLNFENAGQLGTWAQAPDFDIDALVDAYGNVPAALLHTSFQFLKPSMPVTKVKKLFERRRDADFITNFIAMEMWANDVIGFPGLCYKFLIESLYRQNEIRLGGRKLDVGTLALPVLDAMATDDHIVPIETRLPLERATRFDLKGGHIGAVIGTSARKNFWPQWIEWLKHA